MPVERRSAAVGVAVLTAVLLFSACGSEAESTTTSSATDTSLPASTTTQSASTTTVPTTTTVPSTTTIPPTTVPETSDWRGDFDIARETVWEDVFQMLTASEQACIREAVGADLEWVLEQTILSDDLTREWEASVLPCVPPPLVEAIFLAAAVYGMELEGVQVGDQEKACLQEVISGMDVAALLAVMALEEGDADDAAQAETAAKLLEMMAGFFRCLPDLSAFDAGEGGAAGQADDGLFSGGPCPGHSLSDQFEGAARVVLGEAAEGMLELTGDVEYFVFEATEGELYELAVDLGTLGDSVLAVCGADGWELDFNDDREDGSRASALFWEAPESGDFYVGVSGFDGAQGSYVLTFSEIVDDFADGLEGAARVELGEEVEGAVDYPGDADYFVFEATEGELYRVDLGVLSDSWVSVYDADWIQLEYSYPLDQGSPASRLFWKAPVTGDFYVGVSSYGGGPYTLTVGVSDIADDYADGVEGATPVGLEQEVEGVVDYPRDVDYFVFEGIEGELYEVEVGQGTLSESTVTVYAADGWELGSNDDRGDGSPGSRLVWKAVVAGNYFVSVSGYGEGSYTLTVGVSDIVDDYADGVEGATRVGLDQEVEGAVDFPRDGDYFVFRAVKGELYEINVALGTLPDSVVVVYDEDGVELGYADDGVDGSLASHLLWRAPVTGDFYVRVGGLGEGSYTLTVGVSDIVDDYSNGVEGAARVELGESVEGVLDYSGDVDYFVFRAVQGESYEIAVDLLTLSDSVVEVYDAGGYSLDYNDDREDGSLASGLLWRAPVTGDFYVGVSSFGGEEGSYTLMVGASE